MIFSDNEPGANGGASAANGGANGDASGANGGANGGAISGAIGAISGATYRKSLRNRAINYSNGWFFVTCQVARNKSLLGAIAGNRCILNALGEQVRDAWLAIPANHPEVALDEFVVMPNHFHAILKIARRPGNKKHHLGYIMGRFKGATGYIYGKMKKGEAAKAARPDIMARPEARPETRHDIMARHEARPDMIARPETRHETRPDTIARHEARHDIVARLGTIADIGEHLWQFDYWDKIVTSEPQLAAIRKYIRENPANWTRDRYGPCTRYWAGDLSLLDAPKIAFVASQGFSASALKFRRLYGAKAPRPDMTPRSIANNAISTTTNIGAGGFSRPDAANDYSRPGTTTNIGAGGFSRPDAAIISTFTSTQEREVLRRALAKGRPVIAVVPQGIDIDAICGTKAPRRDMAPIDRRLVAALREKKALAISPQPPGSSLNKKVATWCNEYVLRHADEVWAGDISPNGMLAALTRETIGIAKY